MMTKAERLAELKTQSAVPCCRSPARPRHRSGDVYVVRFLANDGWFLEVWSRENGQWKTAAVQVTSAKK